MELKTKKEGYKLIPELGVIVNESLEAEYLHLLPSLTDEKDFLEFLEKDLSDEDIDREFCSIRNITLNLTDECNYRCGYCIYSGNYDIARTHTSKKMDLETAKKAIDFFIRFIKNKKRKIKAKYFNIGFYGGEALLEFQLMKQIIEYAEKKIKTERIDDKFKLNYSMTTNGFLLKGEIVSYLVEKRFLVDVSMDGPAEEHDKFRITKNGESTWNVIWENLRAIKEKYPDFYEDQVNIFCTLHPGHDYSRVDAFFMENTDFFKLDGVKVNYVNRTLLKGFAKENFISYKSQPLSKISLIRTAERLEDKLRLKNIAFNSPFTQNCFPGGAKPFVASDGTLHVCERVKPDTPIGNVFDGIDYEAVRRIQRQWNREIVRMRCWECPAWGFCNVCMARSEEKGGVAVKCNYQDYMKDELLEFLEYKEAEQEKKDSEMNDLNETDVRRFVSTL